MENVGLITYRDAYLVLDEAKASQSELQACLDVIGHEIAHQWFGNLVTMRWWEGAWLNEAFASFMELKATDSRKPDWKRWLAFANLEVPWAMGTDQLATTRPIEFEVNSPAEVDEMFDSITYGKGSAVLRMIEQFIGEEEFRTGVGNYLRKHEYANTVTSDLWEGLDGAADWPVGEIMDTWVNQKGFPQIDVRVVPEGIHLSQRRFLAIPDETDITIWDVPIQLRGVVGGEPFETKVLLTEDETVVPIEGPFDFVVANAGGHGFYRTRYSDELFTGLLGHLDTLGDIERHILVSDTWAMVRSAQVPASAFLDLVGKFGEETEHAVWSVIIGGLRSLEHHALEEQTRPAFETFVRDLVGPGPRPSRLGGVRGRERPHPEAAGRSDRQPSASWATSHPPSKRHGSSPATSSRAPSSILRCAPPPCRSTRTTAGPRNTRHSGPPITRPTPRPRRSAISAPLPGSRWRNWRCRPWRRSSAATSGPRTGSGSSPASCRAKPGPPSGKTPGAGGTRCWG